jgi:serine/threonine-protein kinase
VRRLADGSTFGRYKILGTLGQGGMGIVYRAHDPSLGKEVALKLLLVPGDERGRYEERFRREADAARSIVHENVVRCLEAGTEKGVPYLVLELVPGGSLQARLDQERRLPWREVAGIGALIARALETIHARGFVHRDVKPANVLVDGRGTPKLADFGLVRPDAGERLTRTGELLGTLEYMAPELSGNERAGPAADLYALGATLYHLLTGAPPFHGHGVSLLAKHLHEKPRSPALLEPTVPAALDAIVLRLLAKDPAARGTASEVAEELGRIERSSGGPRSRRPLVLLSLLAALAVAGTGAAIAFSGHGHDAPAPSPVPPPPTPPAPTPSASPDAPAWFLALSPGERPRLPLQKGLRFGKGAGEYVNEKDGSVLVYVPGGTYAMQRQVEVQLSPYFLGKYEVTVAQYRAFVQKTHRPPAANANIARAQGLEGFWNVAFTPGKVTWEHPSGDARALDAHPVTQVTWDDADIYCGWAGLALPTEAQWERAASGLEGRPFPWGREVPSRTSAPLANVMDKRWLARFPEREAEVRDRDANGQLPLYEDFDHGFPAGPCPVGSFPAGASPCGALDMAGNVREWVADWHTEAFWTGVPGKDPVCSKPPSDEQRMRVVRGGSWNESVDHIFTTVRGAGYPDFANDVTGFRVALVEKR